MPIASIRYTVHTSSYDLFTLIVFPALSFNASSPPGPRLLLRNFFFSVSELVSLWRRIELRSAVAFSLSHSMSLEEVMWARDCRDFGRLGLELDGSILGAVVMDVIA